MDSKISPNIWPDLEDHPAEVKLTFLWCLTNAETAASLLGVFTWRPRRFELDTGLDAEWFQKTVAALAKALLVIGDRVWVRNYIRYQFGTGHSLATNKVSKGLVSRLEGLPKGFHTPILEAYPELKGLSIPLHPPFKGLIVVEGEELASNAPSPKGVPDALQTQALASPMQGPEQSRAEQSRAEQGESEGETAMVAFGREWPGDPARSIPAGIPEAYVLRYRNWRLEKKPPGFPKAWREDLLRRFVANWLEGMPSTRHEAAPVNGKPADSRADLVAELGRTTDQKKRDALLKKLKNAAE